MGNGRCTVDFVEHAEANVVGVYVHEEGNATHSMDTVMDLGAQHTVSAPSLQGIPSEQETPCDLSGIREELSSVDPIIVWQVVSSLLRALQPYR